MHIYRDLTVNLVHLENQERQGKMVYPDNRVPMVGTEKREKKVWYFKHNKNEKMIILQFIKYQSNRGRLINVNEITKKCFWYICMYTYIFWYYWFPFLYRRQRWQRRTRSTRHICEAIRYTIRRYRSYWKYVIII